MKDKVIIITGGSSGIGKALAEEFGKKGAKILITGRTASALDDTVNQLSAKGIEINSIIADVSLEEDNKRMADEAVRLYGKIDVLINNAGITMRALFEEVDIKVIRKTMDINFFGPLYASKYCLPEIIKTKGSIIGISSIAGYRGLPGRTGYSASKFALQGFLEVLRSEMHKKGVHVLTACPGFTNTNIRKKSLLKDGSLQGDTPRDEHSMMSAEEVAQHIYKATVKRKKILILTTQGKVTVLLNKWFPGWMDKVVYNQLAKEANSPFK
ncbi:MAG TPA: SDR family oxidoreductase [Cyclobacteriaceae bacterium]|nr:SDR family oxidoreductase [Cyclobacteriaceae bacterium]